MTTIYARVLLAILIMTGTALAAERPDVAGRYELEGSVHIAGSLILHPDHTYEARFFSEADDWVEGGRWEQDGDDVVLQDARFLKRNAPRIELLLISGTGFIYTDDRLVFAVASPTLVFVKST